MITNMGGGNPATWIKNDKPSVKKTVIQKEIIKKEIDCTELLVELNTLSSKINSMRDETPHKCLYDAEMSLQLAKKALENITKN